MVEGKGAARLRASKPLVRRGRWAQPMEGEEMEPEDNEAGEAEAGRGRTQKTFQQLTLYPDDYRVH